LFLERSFEVGLILVLAVRTFVGILAGKEQFTRAESNCAV